MKTFEVEFSYKVNEWGTVIINTDDSEIPSEVALDYVRDAFPDAIDIEIDEIKEIQV